MSSLLKFKGMADIGVAGILMVKPSLIYNSEITRGLAAVTGLHLSNADIAPGFNQSIACMVASVGVGHIVAGYSGPAARPPFFAMTLTWGLLGVLTCATPKEWGLGSATLLMTSINHTVFSAVMYLVDPAFQGQIAAEKRE